MRKFVLVLGCILIATPAGAISCGGYAKCRYDEHGAPHFNHRAATCSMIHAKCIANGQPEAACAQRLSACQRTGCWSGPHGSGCGLVR
jgi:hypothetical protein